MHTTITTNRSKTSTSGPTSQQIQLLEKARSLSSEDMELLEQKEFITPEELKLMLYKIVDEEYHGY